MNVWDLPTDAWMAFTELAQRDTQGTALSVVPNDDEGVAAGGG